MVTPIQAVFGIDMLFNLASVVYCRVVTDAKLSHVDIDNVSKTFRRVMHDYAIDD